MYKNHVKNTIRWIKIQLSYKSLHCLTMKLIVYNVLHMQYSNGNKKKWSDWHLAKKEIQAGSTITIRTRKNENPKIIEWLNAQTEMSTSLNFLIEQEIMQNGIVDLSTQVVSHRPLLPTTEDIYPHMFRYLVDNKGFAVHIDVIADDLADEMGLSDAMRNLTIRTGSQRQWSSLIWFVRMQLQSAGYIDVRDDCLSINEKGRQRFERDEKKRNEENEEN